MPSFKHALAKLRDMPACDRRVLLVATVLMPLVRLTIALAGLARVMAWMETARGARREASFEEVRALARVVNLAAARAPGGASCLTRSVVLQWILLRRGIHAQIRIGVRLTDGRLEAHAWVQYGGHPVNDRADVGEAFLAFDQPITAPARAAP